MSTWWNRFLEIDLSKNEINTFEVEESWLKDFIGGSGLAARLFLSRVLPDVDPLGPENELYVMTGPLAGTGFPGSSRLAVCARSPLTKIWGEGTVGGDIAPEVKRSGFDGFVIKGVADRPSMLIIEDGKARIEDASALWGKDTYDSIDALNAQFGKPKRARSLVIGPAGENSVPIAAICNDKGDFVGRTGMGAVMGSKRLKAIVVRGSQRPTLARQEGAKEWLRDLNKRVKSHMTAQSLNEMGTDVNMDLGMMTGDVPIKNWTVGEDYDLSANLGGPAMIDSHFVKAKACRSCPIACKRVCKVTEGPFAMEEGPGPEYETCCTFGTLLGNSDLAGVCKANELCNRLGLDTISCGATIAWAMHCHEEGLLSAEALNGISLKWGNIEGAIELVDKIARREGIGDVLAEGVRTASERLGVGADFTTDVKGLEAPAHDPRCLHGMGLAYTTSPRGACHLQHKVLYVEAGMTAYPEVGLESDYIGQTSDGKAKMVLLCENLGVPMNAAVICKFVLGTLSAQDFADMLERATGFGFDIDKLMTCGARIWLIKRALNCMMGMRRKDDRLPKLMLAPTTEGGAEGSVPEIDRMLDEYYEMRGLDPDGLPTRETLEKIGLADVADRLYG
ncbi:MAG: aldehyde ferredoxin oxidoreductase family protein [Planctomycetes bacterium]|nr:aldehyde ferredoxin oxidoreductase family protein [Planctomycetota bacterium]